MTYTLLLPPTCPESDAQTIVVAMSDVARALGIRIGLAVVELPGRSAHNTVASLINDPGVIGKTCLALASGAA